VIRELIVDHVRKQQAASRRAWIQRHQGAEPKLHPSSLGGCPRKAIWQAVDAYPNHPLHVDVTHPFDLYVQEVMHAGNVWEEENARALEAAGATRHPHIGNQHWTAEPDFALRENGTLHIIEHKNTAEHNFAIKRRLPYEFHCAQLACYGALVDAREAVDCILYYHGRGHWAEFRVWPDQQHLVWEGRVDGKLRSGVFDFDLAGRMAALEGYWTRQQLPPRYESPFTRTFGGCVRGSKRRGYWPGCPYFAHCWPELPQEGPFDEEVCD